MGLFGDIKKKLFGNSVMDELGGVGGFLLGGPAGAAGGAAAGRAVHGAIKGESIGDIAKGALGTGVKAGGAAYGSQALLGAGGAANAARAAGARALPAGLDLTRKGGSQSGGITGLLGQGADLLGLRKEDGSIDFQKLLKGGALAGGALAAAGGMRDAGRNEGRRNEMMDESRGIAREQAEHGRQLLAEAAPMRQAANAAILAKMNAAPRPLPNIAGLQDTANPFRKKFPGGVPPMMVGA